MQSPSQGRHAVTGHKRPQTKASYAELKRRIKEHGLLEKQPGFVTGRMLVTFSLLGLSVALLFITNSLWLQVPNAVFMALVFGHIGFIAHDVGHRQGFRKPRTNDVIGLVHANLLLGMSFGWWLDKHNAHHANPNQHDLDPDIDIGVIAFSEEDALARRGLFRFLVRYQAIFFFPMLLFQAWTLRIGSISFLLNHRWRYRKVEILLLVLHAVLYLGVIFGALGFWRGLLFIVIQQALFGFYLASVFAPNHKGMLVLDADAKIDFLQQQILTARNVYAHRLTNFWYGGLNFQIEHHLFPTMARNKLTAAHRIVKQFCTDHGIPYYETSIFGSYREILQYLHHVSAPLRTRGRAVSS